MRLQRLSAHPRLMQALMLRDLRLHPGETTAAAFARIDTNGDKLVSCEELRAAGVPGALADTMMERGDVRHPELKLNISPSCFV